MKEYEGSKIRSQPEDWETRVVSYDRERAQEIRRAILDTIQPRHATATERRENVISASANSAEIVAVIEGRKPLFHEQYGELSDPYARAIGRRVPRGVIAESFDGHVIAYRPALVRTILDSDPAFYRPNNQSDKDAIVRAVLSDATGELMGYGARVLQEKGSVLVRIFDGDDAVAGFYTPSDQAAVFAEARLADYERFWGKELRVDIGVAGSRRSSRSRCVISPPLPSQRGRVAAMKSQGLNTSKLRQIFGFRPESVPGR